jgi:hypothetical protein
VQPNKTVAISTRLLPYAETRDRAGDLQIFSLTLSQLSYRGCKGFYNVLHTLFRRLLQGVCRDFIGKVFTKLLRDFHKDVTVCLQGCLQGFYKAFTKCLTVFYDAFRGLLQGVYKDFRGFFSQGFYKAFTRFSQGLYKAFYKVFYKVSTMFCL